MKTEKKQILNIVNVIRAYEPRNESIDLMLPVKEQARLMLENNLKGTFLIQYDALIDPKYTDFLKSLPSEKFEIGIWYEVVQQLCDDCGIEWTGRYSWDWHCHCCYPLGYPLREREILVDGIYKKFKEIFGYYPEVFGAWLFDTHTLKYMEEKYSPRAMCCCKEQYGTDGYTLWGGIYGQAYYPSRTNWFIPAGREGEHINIPMFRMLGSDPVYQYDLGLDFEKGPDPIQKVLSLEPVYNPGGGEKGWTDWFIKENYNGKCLCFGYAQTGQENNFGWESMAEGLRYQFEVFGKLSEKGEIDVQTLGESGIYFKKSFKETPPSVIFAESAFDNDDIKSLWYSCKNYRINLFMAENQICIRDLYLYSDHIKDTYDEIVCEGNDATYEALPVIDGNRYSGNMVKCGACPLIQGKPYSFESYEYKEIDSETVELAFYGEDGALTVLLTPLKIEIYGEKLDEIRFQYGKSESVFPQISWGEKSVDFEYKGMEYSLTIEKGSGKEQSVIAENGVIILKNKKRS